MFPIEYIIELLAKSRFDLNELPSTNSISPPIDFMTPLYEHVLSEFMELDLEKLSPIERVMEFDSK